MYKLINKLFGYDYIAWDNGVDSGIARIMKGYDGVVWYWRYKSIKVFDVVRFKEQVLWLTCPPDKYFTN